MYYSQCPTTLMFSLAGGNGHNSWPLWALSTEHWDLQSLQVVSLASGCFLHACTDLLSCTHKEGPLQVAGLLSVMLSVLWTLTSFQSLSTVSWAREAAGLLRSPLPCAMAWNPSPKYKILAIARFTSFVLHLSAITETSSTHHTFKDSVSYILCALWLFQMV